jgi:hypothetical protein
MRTVRRGAGYVESRSSPTCLYHPGIDRLILKNHLTVLAPSSWSEVMDDIAGLRMVRLPAGGRTP